MLELGLVLNGRSDINLFRQDRSTVLKGHNSSYLLFSGIEEPIVEIKVNQMLMKLAFLYSFFFLLLLI